ncbi:PREDICTED: uncharacterized protein LOC109333922 [Lupinus angustifolius]|uniref:uncharacterized protein LOC109333922 n=1 Tax=Lupinus angustifolius TaxID=3871 RepID=UPI00092F5A99|nr:PREDICTED: uncharacterized protein LOC109333922 [Lupinus angustifolius]
MPTDENLKLRGMALPSICNLCWSNDESSDHLFFNCNFANLIWNWLSTQFGYYLDHASLKSLMSFSTQWSPQLKQVLVAGIINSISVIWFCRNKAKFDNLSISFDQAIAKIKLDTSFTGNFSKLYVKPSLLEFSILRAFHVHCNYSKAPAISEVNWVLHSIGWVKINIDGAARGSPRHVGGPQGMQGVVLFSGMGREVVWGALLLTLPFRTPYTQKFLLQL